MKTAVIAIFLLTSENLSNTILLTMAVLPTLASPTRATLHLTPSPRPNMDLDSTEDVGDEEAVPFLTPMAKKEKNTKIRFNSEKRSHVEFPRYNNTKIARSTSRLLDILTMVYDDGNNYFLGQEAQKF